MTDVVYVGWDVGGWNCDKNSTSRDALVMLDSQGEILGFPWRGNLAHLINESDNQQAFLSGVFDLCELDYQQQHKILLQKNKYMLMLLVLFSVSRKHPIKLEQVGSI